MFRSRTVFVVGAGAGQEVGLPTGPELIPIIRNKLNFTPDRPHRHVSGDPTILEILRRDAWFTSQDVNQYTAAGKKIYAALFLANSIDDFMDMHRDDKYVQACGKLAIVQSILEAERGSKLYFDRFQADSFDLESLSQTWLVQFMRILRQGISKSELHRIFENVSFIVFNYDRCVEHFLFHAIRLAYALDNPDELNSIFSTLRIFHPYGSVGLYCRYPTSPSPSDVLFGSDDAELVSLANNIKTYTEQIENPSEIEKINVEIRQADALVFLGFAFHPQNMRLLQTDGENQITRVYATAVGISQSDINVTKEMIRRMVQTRSLSIAESYLNVANKTCYDLFQEYWRSLTLG
jgi:hypothetical protein